MTYNINDNIIVPEFRYSEFKMNEEYSIRIMDFNFPEVKEHPGEDNRVMLYIIWSCQSTKDYTEEGIYSGVPYKQHFPKHGFEVAYSRYRYMDRQFRESIKGRETERFMEVMMTFMRKDRKTLKITNITIL